MRVVAYSKRASWSCFDSVLFSDRHHAGILLGEKLSRYRGISTLVMGLARGGVVVGHAVAKTLGTPLDVLVIKKIPAPGNSELAIGALAPEDVSFIDWRFAGRVGADEKYIREEIEHQQSVIREKTHLYRKGNKPYQLKGKIVILVDDGAATGATLEAAIKWAKKKHAHSVVAAVPVAPRESVGKIKPEVHELVILETPADFSAVGQFYKNFPQVEDADVVELLKKRD